MKITQALLVALTTLVAVEARGGFGGNTGGSTGGNTGGNTGGGNTGGTGGTGGNTGGSSSSAAACESSPKTYTRLAGKRIY